jgi:hypothetical protein
MTRRRHALVLLAAACLGVTAVAPGDASAGGRRHACVSDAPTPPTSLPPELQGIGADHEVIGAGTLWTVAPRDPAQGDEPGTWTLGKQPWFRLEEGELTIKGRRIDGGSGTVRVHLPAVESYPLDMNLHIGPGFIPSSFDFPGDGCWQLTARLGTSKVVLRLRIPGSPPPSPARAPA